MPDRDRRTVDDVREASTVVEIPSAKRPVIERGEVTAPTVVQPAVPVSASGQSAPQPRPTREADAAAFDLTLRRAEIARTQRMVPFLTTLALAAAALVPFAGGDPLAIRVVYAGIACALAATGYLYWLSREISRFTEGRLAIVHGVSITTVFTAVYYWGIFSPAASIVALFIFFVTLGRSLRVGAGLYLWTAACQGGLAFLVIGGHVPDAGLITAGDAGVRERVIEQIMIQVVFAITYLAARATRLQLDHAVSDHDQAVRAVSQREALLVEARQDLDQALKLGGPGRYTDQLVGSYRLGVVLGRGAMGDVYEAVHAETGAPAAVKLLNATALATPRQLARFYREAEAVAKLASPHIVHLLEVSSAETTIPYLAMERLHGRDLAQVLRERRRLPLAEAVVLVQQVARGLEAARAADIVHRDIKPQNLFRAEVGGTALWKILDFGISKLGDHQGTLTKDHVVGTPMYMAPEQARGNPVDHRVDGLALATVCYRAITGQPPYTGSDVPTILYNVVHKMPPCPSELAKLPRDIDRVLAIGMAKLPDQRFATSLELADAFTAAAAGQLGRELRARGDAMIDTRPWQSER